MTSLHPVLSLILLLAFLPGCAAQCPRRFFSAILLRLKIYWGKTENSLEKTRLTTPSSRSLSAPKWESCCYQVKKEGYRDSEITCRGEEGFRYLDFRLIPLKTAITSEPPEAIIYCGPTKDRLERTDFRTPRTITIKDLPTGYGSAWENWYLQVKKEGFQDSEIISLPRQQDDRSIHFELTPVAR